MNIKGYAKQIKLYRQTTLLYRLYKDKEAYRRDHKYSLTEVEDKGTVKDLGIRNVAVSDDDFYRCLLLVIRTKERISWLYHGYTMLQKTDQMV